MARPSVSGDGEGYAGVVLDVHVKAGREPICQARSALIPRGETKHLVRSRRFHAS